MVKTENNKEMNQGQDQSEHSTKLNFAYLGMIKKYPSLLSMRNQLWIIRVQSHLSFTELLRLCQLIVEQWVVVH